MVLINGVIHRNCNPLIMHIAHTPLIIFPSPTAPFIPYVSSPYCTYSHSFPHLSCVCLLGFACFFVCVFAITCFDFLVVASVLCFAEAVCHIPWATSGEQ